MPLNDEQPSSADDHGSDVESCSAGESSGSNPSPSSPPTASPPKVVDCTSELFGLRLTHQILMDRHYHMRQDPLPEGSLLKMISDNMHKAFWDILEEELNDDPPQYGQAISLLEDIRETLLFLLTPLRSGGPPSSLQTRILEVLDLDLIRQQAHNDAVDVQGLAAFVIATMGRMCAPDRDEEIRKLRESTADLVTLFREIFRVLDIMKVDTINYFIMGLRPFLQQHGVAYQSEQFQKVLEKNPSALDRTTAWIRSALEELLPAGWRPDGGKDRVALPGPTQILNTAYLQILTWDYSRGPLPETLVSDEQRLQDLQQQLRRSGTVNQVLLIVFSSVGRPVQDLPSLSDRLKKMVAVLLDGMHHRGFDLGEALKGVGVKVCCELNKSLSGRGYPPLSAALQDALRGQICSVAHHDNPVRSRVEDRVQQYFKTLLSSSGPNVKPDEVPASLAAIRPELAALAANFLSLVKHNRAVYTPFYMEVIKELLFSQAPPAQPAGGQTPSP